MILGSSSLLNNQVSFLSWVCGMGGACQVSGGDLPSNNDLGVGGGRIGFLETKAYHFSGEDPGREGLTWASLKGPGPGM